MTLFETMFRNRWENFESNDDILCLITLFETMFEIINYLITTYSTFFKHDCIQGDSSESLIITPPHLLTVLVAIVGP